ncbi:glycosyl hydrolase family protein (plasmid) [Leisingera sp. NJS201]|uniref:family 16 glycosylhydrolase n=1 Tax=Leisingera sp. NJS201 TaxID=2508306 RepID=UPI00107127A9|nr:family 16 glycosylhydrolase [Leisingera sp. NJS201]QBR38579.1 glycosyl hydrolase family protein [Leisingera sp. NJS201]
MSIYGGWRRPGFGALAVALAVLPSWAASEIQDSGFLSRMDDLDSGGWYISDFSVKKPSFRTGWSRTAVETGPEDGAVLLSLAPAPPETGKDFQGGELQWRQATRYGRYEVVMTAARGEGVISSFFTYTGPYFDDPHNEIDFEFLGRDTTKAWVNRFTDGKKLPGQWIGLGFDAAAGPHVYAFEWTEDSLAWFADGKELLRITGKEAEIPSRPQKIYLNIWGGAEAQRDWSGFAPNGIRAVARYYCVSYRPLGALGQQCSDLPVSQ